MQVPKFSFTAVDGPISIARDGEVGDEYDEVTLHVRCIGCCRCFEPATVSSG